MKGLLTALKQRAIDNMPSLGGEKGVHLLSDENALPETTPFPCLGLKDGAVKNQYKTGKTNSFLEVDFICYVLINSPEGVIVGDAANPGILDIIEEAKAAFAAYDPTGYVWNASNGQLSETASQMMTSNDKLIQKKKFTMQWYKFA